MKVQCISEIAGEYLVAGETYDVTVPNKPNRSSQYYFKNMHTGAGTMMTGASLHNALKSGQIVEI